jgi:hypothetical protein
VKTYNENLSDKAGFRLLLSKNRSRTAANFSRPTIFFWGRF